MPQLSKSYKQDFEDGTTVNVALYQSDKGQMAITSFDGANPFNHGGELVIRRQEIAERAERELNCKAEDIYYVEQTGQHWRSVPFSRGEDGQYKVPDAGEIKTVPEQSLKDEISRHTRQSLGEEHLKSPNWTDHLSHPNSPDR